MPDRFSKPAPGRAARDMSPGASSRRRGTRCPAPTAGDAAQLHKDRHLLMASYLGEVGAEQAETDPEPTRQED